MYNSWVSTCTVGWKGVFRGEWSTCSFLAFFDFELALVSSASTKAFNTWDCQTGVCLTVLPSIPHLISYKRKCPSISLVSIAVGDSVYVKCLYYIKTFPYVGRNGKRNQQKARIQVCGLLITFWKCFVSCSFTFWLLH